MQKTQAGHHLPLLTSVSAVCPCPAIAAVTLHRACARRPGRAPVSPAAESWEALVNIHNPGLQSLDLRTGLPGVRAVPLNSLCSHPPLVILF